MHAPQIPRMLISLPQKVQAQDVSTRRKPVTQFAQRIGPCMPQHAHKRGYIISRADVKRSSTVFVELESMRKRKRHEFPTVNGPNAAHQTIPLVKSQAVSFMSACHEK